MADKKSDVTGVEVPPVEGQSKPPISSLNGVHKPNKLERHFLVWTKRFKSTADVPAYITRDMMEKTRNIIRIRTNLSIMALVVVGSLVAVWSGKQAAERGESVTKNNLKWHEGYNEKNKQAKSEG